MSSSHKLVHSVSIPIRWGDMDAQGHVNNTVYFQYMEQARVEWLESLRQRAPAVGGLGSVIVNASCTFLLPLAHPGVVQVRMLVGAHGRSSVDTHYEMWMNDRKYAEGSARIVWIDEGTSKSTPLPQGVLAIWA
jgi:acyl-CoA thioester hydrolase